LRHPPGQRQFDQSMMRDGAGEIIVRRQGQDQAFSSEDSGAAWKGKAAGPSALQRRGMGGGRRASVAGAAWKGKAAGPSALQCRGMGGGRRAPSPGGMEGNGGRAVRPPAPGAEARPTTMGNGWRATGPVAGTHGCRSQSKQPIPSCGGVREAGGGFSSPPKANIGRAPPRDGENPPRPAATPPLEGTQTGNTHPSPRN
jgi:hypothetical protein